MDKYELKLEMAKLKQTKPQSSKKNKYGKWIVAMIIILNTGFAIGVLGVFWHTSSEPIGLVGSWFAFTGGELWLLANIKKTKISNIKTFEKNEINKEEDNR